MELKTYNGHAKLADSGRGSAVIATLNVIDKDGDVTLPGAFGNQKAHLMPMHVRQSAEPPFIGSAAISERANEAVADFQLNLDLGLGKQWSSALKFALDRDLTVEWSYGFRVLSHDFGNVDGKQVRFLRRVRVFEVSPVLLGAGENTRTLTMKAAAPSPATLQHVYLRVNPAHVDPHKKELAHEAAEWAERVLGLGFTPEIYWFTDGKHLPVIGEHFKHDIAIRGCYDWHDEPRMIRVKAEQSELATVETVLHECCHAAQYKRAAGFDEAGARAFEAQVDNFLAHRREASYWRQVWYDIPGYSPYM